LELLYFLEKIRVPILNEFMLWITKFGEETAFLVLALVVFWCIDKRKGYFILSVGFIGTITSQFMKLMCRIPRPWVLDKNFTILEQAREAASGYSFPSGHSQSAVGTFGSLAYLSKNKWIKWTAVAIAVLVPVSRMYIGVHTPWDVLVGSLISVVLIFALKPVVFSENKKCLPILLCVMTVMAVAYTCFVEFYPFPSNIDVINLASGRKNAYTLLGALSGFLVVYTVDEKWLNFSTKAVWWAQILKVAIGLILVLAVKSGLKEPLNFLFGELAGRSARYCLIVITAGILWPLSFKWFAKLGKRE
jgi:membrane-associated phospholipid phosphatase